MAVRCGAIVVLAALAAFSAEPSLDLARTRAATGDWAGAEEHSRRYLSEHPDDEAAAVLHATSLIRLSQPFDAALELEEILKRHTSFVEASKLYAALLVDVLDDAEGAGKLLAHCSQLAPGDPQVWEGLGKLNLRRRKSAEAMENFRQASRIDPANPVYVAEMARCMEETDEDFAGQTYLRAIQLNSQKAAPESSVYISYGLYLSNNQKYGESAAYYTKALEIDPHSSEAYQDRAAAYEKAGEIAKAESDALRALRESTKRKDSHQLLLRIYRERNDEARIQEHSQALLRISEDERAEFARNREMRSALNSAEAALAKQQFSQAIPSYERVVSLMPSFYEAYFALGVCYQQTGDPAKAESALRKYLEFQPLSADGHAALGLLLYNAGKPAMAKPLLERSLELNPQLAEPRRALVKMSLDSHNPAGARKLLSGWEDSGEPESSLLYARVLFGSGQKREAMAVVERGLAQSPGNPGLEEMNGLLLTECERLPECRMKAIEALRGNPASPSYLKTVTGMLVENAPLEASTADMVKRTHGQLPDDAAALYIYAKWLYAVNRTGAALEAARQAASKSGADAAVRSRAVTLVALSEDRLGRVTAAEEAFRQALELDRRLSFPDPQIALAYVEFLKRDAREEEAGKIVAEILAWSPANGPAHLFRANSLSRAGKPEQAAAEAQLALDWPDADLQLQRAAHSLLARAYAETGRSAQAQAHVNWLSTH